MFCITEMVAAVRVDDATVGAVAFKLVPQTVMIIRADGPCQ